MDEATIAKLRDRGCTGKPKLGAVKARQLAQQAQNRGHDVHPYRCPWCAGWHTGHTMSWEAVEHLAEAIRHQAYSDGAHIERRSA